MGLEDKCNTILAIIRPIIGITIGIQFRIIISITSPTTTILHSALHIGANIVTHVAIQAMAAYTIIQIFSMTQNPMNIITQIGAIAVAESNELTLPLSLFMGTKRTIETLAKSVGGCFLL